MTMRYAPNVSITATDVTLKYLFEFLDFMRTASPTGPGWTIPLSSNGTTGGAGDNIATFSDLSQYVATTSESWFVLEAPDSSIQLLWFRTNASDTVWSLSISPDASYSGGDAGNPPTATTAYPVHAADTILGAVVNSVVHIGADDAAPYGWHIYCNASGDLTDAQGGMALIPITDGMQPGDTDLYVFYYDGGNVGYTFAALSAETAVTTSGRVAGITPGASSWDAIPALGMAASGFFIFPDGCAQNTNGDDVSAPISFARRAALSPSGFKGFTDFMQWNGTIRAPGETFASLTRVSWGAVNFPWDGTTTPSAT